MTASKKVLVYSYRRCPFAMRVRIALHEKGVAFETREEDLKNKSSELLRLHPEGRVPLLVHGDQVVYESAIITEYIEESFPTPALMPRDAGGRAEVRLWTYWCNMFFKPDVDRLKYGKSRFPADECVGIEANVQTHLKKLESALSGEWLVGAGFSLGDIHVFPFARQLFAVKPEPLFLKEYPRIKAWIGRLEARESFKRAMEK